MFKRRVTRKEIPGTYLKFHIAVPHDSTIKFDDDFSEALATAFDKFKLNIFYIIFTDSENNTNTVTVHFSNNKDKISKFNFDTKKDTFLEKLDEYLVAINGTVVNLQELSANKYSDDMDCDVSSSTEAVLNK
jgi:hypothetical protein